MLLLTFLTSPSTQSLIPHNVIPTQTNQIICWNRLFRRFYCLLPRLTLDTSDNMLFSRIHPHTFLLLCNSIASYLVSYLAVLQDIHLLISLKVKVSGSTLDPVFFSHDSLYTHSKSKSLSPTTTNNCFPSH